MPNRILKDSIRSSDSVNSLSWFEEVLFYRLIVSADDFGRFDGRAAIIKGICFPLKSGVTTKQIDAAISNLATAGILFPYIVDGKPYLQFSNWGAHQQKRANTSKYPAPTTENVKSDSENTQMIADDINCNQMIADDSRFPRETNTNTRNDIRETNTPPISPCEKFREFVSSYPKTIRNLQAAEIQYCKCLVESPGISEDNLIAASQNYTDEVRIKGTEDRYIKDARNFLKDAFYAAYLPENYVKPDKPKEKNSFNNFKQNQYDYDALLQKVKVN